MLANPPPLCQAVLGDCPPDRVTHRGIVKRCLSVRFEREAVVLCGRWCPEPVHSSVRKSVHLQVDRLEDGPMDGLWTLAPLPTLPWGTSAVHRKIDSGSLKIGKIGIPAAPGGENGWNALVWSVRTRQYPKFGLSGIHFSPFFKSPPRRAGWGAGAGFVFQGPPWRARPTGVSHGASRGGQGLANGAEWEAREDEPPTVEHNVEHYVEHYVDL